jgi:NAD(P)-dependent dehydrogenase (short-subunit alcohol dehydrogenase family)
VALITGSGRNIGRAIAESFAAAGARVVINGHRDREALDETAAAIRANGGEVLPVMADVSDHNSVSAMVAETVKTFGAIDIVVSNVGIRKYRAFLEITPEEWDDVLRSNLSAAFYLARAAIPHMREKKFGRIVVISGADGFWGHVTHRASNVTACTAWPWRSPASSAPTTSPPTPSLLGRLIRCATGRNMCTRNPRTLSAACPWAVTAMSMRSPAPACSWQARRAGSSPAR